MSMLLERGAKVDESPTGSPSALCMAVYRGDAETAETLLRYSADVNLKPLGGHSPLFSAASNGDTRLMLMLRRHTPYPSTLDAP
jgi:ankyrin repeat protein